jgi:phage anti-repressor protein
MDFKTYALEAIKQEAIKSDDLSDFDLKFIDDFAFSFSSDDPYPVSVEKLVTWKVDKLKGHAVKRLKKGFKQDVDFLQTFTKSTGGRPGIKIMITVDCFKALCMLAQNEMGKQVRRYYLILERLWKSFMESRFVEQQQLLESKEQTIHDKEQTIHDKEQTIHEQEHKLTLAESQLYNLKRRHKYIDKEFKKESGFYIISDAEAVKCSDKCDRQIRCKVGIDTVNIVKRLAQHRTDIPTMKIDYLVYLSPGDCVLLEKMVLRRYRDDLYPFLNHEWIFDVPIGNVVTAAEHYIKYSRMNHICEEKIVTYNDDISRILNLAYTEEDDNHQVLEKKIDAVSQTVKEQEQKHGQDNEEIQRRLKEIETRLSKLSSLRNNLYAFKLKELRDNLEEFGLNKSGQKSIVFQRLREHIDQSTQNLIAQIPALHFTGISNRMKTLIEEEKTAVKENVKQCSKCDKILPVSNFYISTRSKDGYRDRCKNCFDTRVQGTGKCIDCDGEISKRATRCKSCGSKVTLNRRCPNKPSKEEFTEMLAMMKQKDIADKVGVHKSTIIKWKKEYGL